MLERLNAQNVRSHVSQAASTGIGSALQERYGWVTRAVADAELDDLVSGMAARIASFDLGHYAGVINEQAPASVTMTMSGSPGCHSPAEMSRSTRSRS